MADAGGKGDSSCRKQDGHSLCVCVCVCALRVPFLAGLCSRHPNSICLETQLGSAPTNQARVQRVKEIVTQMDAKCTLFEIALRRGATGGYGFRLGSSRSVGHIVAHVGGDGPAAGLLTPGDMVLAVNHNLLLR